MTQPAAIEKTSARAARRKGAFVDDYLSYLLARASHAVYKEFNGEVRAAGLTSLEWRVLATLSDGDGLTIGELAQEVIAQQPTLTKLLLRMESAGLLKRRASADDGRKTLVHESRRGREVIGPLLAASKRHEAILLASFKPDDVQALKKILHGLIARFHSRHD